MSLLPIRRALVVDSDFAHLQFVSETLKLLGVPDVETCRALGAAARRCQEAEFDLIIAAWEPGAGSMKALFGRGPLLLATPNGPQARRPGAALAQAGAGADGVLPKPFTRWTLLKTLKDLVAGPAGRRLKVVELPQRGTVRPARHPQRPDWLAEEGGAPKA